MVTLDCVNELEELGKIILATRERKGWTHTHLANLANVSISYIQKLESGSQRNAPRARDVFKVAAALGADVEEWNTKYLEPIRQLKQIDSPNVPQHKPIEMEPIPMWECAIAAGGWVECDDVFKFATDSLEYRSILKQGLFRVRISGDSMEPDWHDGSWVEFKRMYADENGFERGEDYYIHRADNKATFKRYLRSDEDAHYFVAVNRKKYKNEIVVPRHDVALVAIAVGTFQPKKGKAV